MTAPSDPVARAVNAAITAAIREHLEHIRESQRWLARACNVSPSYFAGSRASPMSLRSLYRAADALDVEVADILPTLAEYREIRDDVIGR